MTKPNVLIDGLVFENTYQIGIWRLFYEILNRISNCADVTIWLRDTAVQPLPNGVRIIQDRGRVQVHRYNIPARIKNKLLAPYCVVKSAQLPQNTVFHSTFFTSCPIDGMVQVTSLFDMIAETHYSIMGSWAPQNAEQKQQELTRANRIIAISNSAAADLIRFYPACKEKVDVVQLGSDHLLSPKSLSPRTESTRSFALFVGHRDSYKNFTTLLNAMTRPEWPTGMLLHVVGSPFAVHELRLIRALNLNDQVVNLGRLSDDDLRTQYATATCFVFPSLAEGFGLPVLEAQINHCPVACSDIAVFKEVAGDAAVYFDPRVPQKIALAIRELNDKSLRNQLLTLGNENARRFSWDHAAEQMFTIYRDVSKRL